MSKHMKHILFLTVSVLSLQGCMIATPILNAYHESGISESDRRNLFTKQAKLFHEALQWGSVDEAVAMAKEESQPKLMQSLKPLRKGVRFAGASMEFVEFTEDAYNAEAHVRARVYAPDSLIIKEQLHREQWEFSIADGWRLVDREPMAEG